MQYKKIIKQIGRQLRLTETKSDRAILMTCIGIAFIFWILVKLAQPYTSECTVLLKYKLPENKVFREIPATKIKVTLEGNGWDLLKEHLNQEATEMTVDFTSKRNFINTSELTSDVMEVLDIKDVNVQTLSPDYLFVNLDNKAYKKIPIKLVDSSSIAEQHFLLDSIHLSQDSVLIDGPASVIKGITVWETIPLSLKDIKETTNITLPLKSPERIQVELNPNKITLQISVERYTEKKFFIPVHIKNAEDSIKIFPKQIQISVAVGVSSYDTLRVEDFKAEIDMKSAVTGSNNIPIIITAQPKAAKTIHFTPKAVEYFILKETSEQKE